MELAIDDAKARAQAMAGQASSPYGKDMSAEKGPLSFGQEVGNMGKQKLAKGLVDEGSKGIMSALTPASAGAANTAALASTPATMGMAGPSLGAAGAGGAGMMATAGAAMPYVGAALLADKALGLGITDSFFSDGGQVGPLSPQYHAGGTDKKDDTRSGFGMLGSLLKGGYNLPKALITGSSLPLIDQIIGMGAQSHSELEALRRKHLPGYYEDPAGNYSAGGPISYKAEGGDTMSREEAMALMNNQPEPMRENPYDRLLAQSMTEGAIGTPESMGRPRPVRQSPMPAPLSRPVDLLQQYKLEGRDKTYNPYDMIRPDNTPNT